MLIHPGHTRGGPAGISGEKFPRERFRKFGLFFHFSLFLSTIRPSPLSQLLDREENRSLS